jgi:hypothetical protein
VAPGVKGSAMRPGGPSVPVTALAATGPIALAGTGPIARPAIARPAGPIATPAGARPASPIA